MVKVGDNQQFNYPVGNPDNQDVQLSGQKKLGPLPVSLNVLESKTGPAPNALGKSFAADLAPPTLLSSDELVALLLTIKSKSSNEQIAASQQDIELNRTKQDQKHADMKEQIQKSIEAGEKAKKGGLFGKIFGWIASIAAVVMAVTAVGVVAGAVMLALAADSMVGAATGHSLMGAMTKGIAKGLQAMGMDESVANIVAGVVTAAVMVAVCVGASMASASKAGSSIISKLASSTSQVQKIQLAAAKVGNIAAFTGGVASVGGGASQITTGVYKKQATDARANQMDMKKELAKLQAAMEAEQDRLKEVIAKLNEGVSRILQIMGNDHSTRMQISRNMV
ncbi:type III secretion system translocon subunit SctE [Hahella sp. HN01]|uniref:type III secretion system translocon subunit SctE n=1 Tax=Hahella sp. HN01 TaxID=2847262 RepID=UPI001C1EEE10|nr:type III secretion system translocon subunit SctE [Hahella sp. HN01]MBU6949799.1 type III secretion system translocon subunit SctE [Hahella sp. HN01]